MKMQDSLSVCHIIAGARAGGAETFCLDMVKSLHESGVRQVVVARPYPHLVEALEVRGIKFYPLGFKRWRKFLDTHKIKKIIAREQPDLVHAWMSRASSFIPSGLGVPVLGWFGGYYKLKNYANCDFYMGVTRDVVRHIGEASGAPDRTYLGHTFGSLDEAPAVKRKQFGLPEKKPLVLLLSRMHRKKGVDVLLEAAAQLPDMVFLLAGDGPELAKYKAQSARLGLEERVHFAGWRNDRAALLALADICVLPSRYEPFGTVIAEAWFAGVPLVATRAAGAVQYVSHGKNGLLSDIDDVEALAHHLHLLTAVPKLKKRLVREGKKTYEALFERGVVTAQLIKNYHDMCARYAAPKKQ